MLYLIGSPECSLATWSMRKSCQLRKTTVEIRKPNKFGFWMFKSRSVVEWTGFRMVPDKCCHLVLPFENWTFQSGFWMVLGQNGCHLVLPLENQTFYSGFRMVLDQMAAILSKPFFKPTYKKSGFRMIPDFEWSVFGSPLYLTLVFC